MPFSAFVIPGFLFHVIIVSTSRRRNGCTFAIEVTNLPTVSSQGMEQRLVVAGRNHGRRGFQQLRFVPSRLLTGLRFQRCQSNDPQKQKHCSFQIRKLNRKELRDCIFFFLAPFPATISSSDCFTGQSPGKRGTRRAKVASAYGNGGSRLEGGGSTGASARTWLQLG